MLVNQSEGLESNEGFWSLIFYAAKEAVGKCWEQLIPSWRLFLLIEEFCTPFMARSVIL
jgi:hypothetical protein